MTARPILSGQIISRDDVAFKRPGDGIQIEEISLILGKRAQRDLDADVIIQLTDFSAS